MAKLKNERASLSTLLMARLHPSPFQKLLGITANDLYYYHVEQWMTQARYKPILIGIAAH